MAARPTLTDPVLLRPFTRQALAQSLAEMLDEFTDRRSLLSIRVDRAHTHARSREAAGLCRDDPAASRLRASATQK
jgi:hypothetical protein